MTKYTIGIDFGTLSARAALVRLSDGEVIDTAVSDYEHAVIEDKLPNTNIKLGQDWALQNPNNYIDSLIYVVSNVVKSNKDLVSVDDIIGVSIDFTACTVLPVKKDGTALMNVEGFYDNPHAWVKLWKHHAAQDHADRLNALARERKESWLPFYGGKISSEWVFPKLTQIAEEAPEVYDAMDRFIEATDWVTWQMTGKEVRNTCTAGYKAIWNEETGFPSNDFFKALHPKLDNVIEEKIGTDFYPVGHRAGGLNEAFAKHFGLNEGIAVAVGNVDAHVSAASTGVVKPNVMLNIMGTSTCDIVLDTKKVYVEGMCGVVKDGAIPGYFAYETGQNAVGDIFAWFVDNCVPESYFAEAASRDLNIHQLLEEKASALGIGESGLLALDWHNGNRSILVDTDLTGMILGLTLLTKPEEIYRALIESTAFGKRIVIDTLVDAGVAIDSLTVCGGLPHKNRMLNQIYADITNKEISIAEQLQAPAVGAAMFAAVAAGAQAGGYATIQDASEKMARLKDETFKPISDNVSRYEVLYQEYKTLHDYFGKGGNDVMKRLKAISGSF